VGEGAAPEHTLETERLLALTGAAFLLCCSGGEPHAATPGDDTGPGAARLAGAAQPGALRGTPAAGAVSRGEGWLELRYGHRATNFLGSLHAVVTDADGTTLGGAEEDVADPDATGERGLSLVLPAGGPYTVSLSATTSDPHPTTCRASVASLRIDAGATARAQIFRWACGDVSGYVPPTPQTDCYWLADWTFVTGTSAAVGELIDVGAAGHDLDGNLPQFSWSTPSPERGRFTDPGAARTGFRCEAAGENLPLIVALSDGTCSQTVTELVACR
jgi:hypothetical protein